MSNDRHAALRRSPLHERLLMQSHARQQVNLVRREGRSVVIALPAVKLVGLQRLDESPTVRRSRQGH